MSQLYFQQATVFSKNDREILTDVRVCLFCSREFGKGFFVFQNFVAIEGEKSLQLEAGFFRSFSEILEIRDSVDRSDLQLEFALFEEVENQILYSRFGGAFSAAFSLF